MPWFQLAEAPVKNGKSDAIWQPKLQRQLWVAVYGCCCSCVVNLVNLFKQKFASPRNDLFATVTLHNNFLSEAL